MANEPKPQPGNAGTGAKVGDAGRPEQGQESGGAGPREDNAANSPKRGPSETKPPGRHR